MPESKGEIGLSWVPKDPIFSSTAKAGFRPDGKVNQNVPESSALWKPSTELVDGHYVAPNDPKKLNKLIRKELQDTAGSSWNAMDPKRHYKKGELRSTKYFQVGTVVESPFDFFTGRLTKKERKATLADELLSNHMLQEYRKRKVRKIEETNRPADNAKWKRKGKHFNKRAKHRSDI